MARLRLGVALLVPAPHDAAVDALRRACGDAALGSVPPHLTLVPPVNVREDRLDAALGVLRRAAAATRPFRVLLGPPATFLPDTPVLHLPVTDADVEGGAAVHRLRDAVFVEPLARSLTWPFVPHVTVADNADPDRIAAAVLALADFTFQVTFERVHLLQEERTDEGRRWTPLADAAFGRPAVVARGGLALELAVTEHPDPQAGAFAAREWPAVDERLFGPDRSGRRPVAITARRDGEVVGLARGRVGAGVAYLAELIVAAHVRGEGVGSHLLAAFESLAAERDCHRLTVRVVAGGPAEAFYRSRGWVDEARIAGWWFGREYLWMRKGR